MPHYTLDKRGYWRLNGRRGGLKMTTKGSEWRVEKNDCNKPYHYRIVTDRNIFAAVSSEANAYLIAAAPDCHRELSGIVDAFERLGWSSFMAEMHRRLPQAKQALAAADKEKQC